MEVALRTFLEGHVTRKAMLIFEDALGPWVKDQVEAHFLAKHGSGPTRDFWRATAAHAERIEARRAERARLHAHQRMLNERLKACIKRDKAAVKQEQREVAARLRALDPAKDPRPPVPRWVSGCPTGSTTAEFLRHDTRWDVHTIVSVMQGLMADVFSRHLPDHFHAKHLLAGIVNVLSLRADRAHGASLAEPDVLEALQRMREVMQLCQCDADSSIAAIDTLLDEAQALVALARAEPGAVCDGPTLAADEANAQRLFQTLSSWERHVELAMGLVTVKVDGATIERIGGSGRLEFANGTVVFGRDFRSKNKKWSDVVKGLGDHFKTIAFARHWYFHHLVEEPCDIAGAYAAMQAVVDIIERVERQSDPWRRPSVAQDHTPTTLTLAAPSSMMKPPVRRANNVVGRDAMVHEFAAALAPPGARVLIHGLPGVGKDTVMAEVAHRDEVRSIGGLQAWVQASSDVVFRRQLIDVFAAHQPHVVRGLRDKADEAIQSIKCWLATHSEWVLFVEDASAASSTLWDVLPDSADDAGTGRVLVTSQADVSKQHGMFANAWFELKPITTDECIELLRLKNALQGKALTAPAPAEKTDDETALRERSAAVGALDVYQAPPGGGNENGRDKKKRHDGVIAKLAPYEEEVIQRRCVGAPEWCYVAAPPQVDESGSDRRQRHKLIERNLFAYGELSRPELREFIEETLGNLPLSVELFANMLRRDRDSSVLDMIGRFNRMRSDLTEADRDGREREDRHYLGLVVSVRICLERLRDAAGVNEADRRNAVTLLAILSLLDRTQTPIEFLSGHDLAKLAQRAGVEGGCFMPSCRAGRGDCGVGVCPSALCTRRREMFVFLADAVLLERARELCVENGLLQEAASRDTAAVGVMHQLVQRCLRGELVLAPVEGPDVVCVVRVMLQERFDFDSFTTAPSRWAELRRIAPCMDAWHALVLDEDVLSGPQSFGRDMRLLSRRTIMMRDTDGDAKAALQVDRSILKRAQQLLPSDHPDIAMAMNTLASTLSDLGRHNDALELQEEVLEFQRRVLPSDHRDIAAAKNNLAGTLSHLGRHNDALELLEEVLEFRRRVLPSDHPDIATTKNNLAGVLSDLGRHNDALVLKREVLEILRRALPPDHPLLATAKSNLATTLSALGRYDDALELKKAVLEFRRRVLPPDHPDIAAAMSNLAATLSDLGRRDVALELTEEVLEMWRRVLPPDHPHIATAMGNLAVTFSNLGRHNNALGLLNDVLQLRCRVLPPDHPDIADAMSNLAGTLSHLGRYNDALELEKEVLAFRLRVLPPDHPDIAAAKRNVAAALSALGRNSDALELKKEVLEFQRRVMPPDHPDIATAKSALAATFSALGRYDDALELQEDVLEFRRRLLPQDHPEMAAAKNNLAATLSDLGRYDEALVLKEEVLEILRRLLPPDHPDIADAMNNIATTLAHLGRYGDALKLQQEVLDFQCRVRPQDHPDIATAKSNLATMLSALGRYDDALELKKAVLEFRRRVLPPDHPDIAAAMSNLAATLSALGRYSDALELEEEVLEFRRRVMPPEHPDTVAAMSALATTFSELRRYNDALKLEEEVLELMRRVMAPDHPNIAIAMNNLAVTYRNLGRPFDAYQLWNETLAFRERILPADHPDIAESKFNLALIMRQLGDGHGAIEHVRGAIEVFRRAGLPEDHPRMVHCKKALVHWTIGGAPTRR